MKKYINKKNIINIIIIIIFIVLSIIISNKHEHWADEATAWLISNDLSILDMFKYMNYDGHPILFFVIVKLFCTLGLKYNNFNIISILFSTLGITILLNKSNFKWYIKILLPFTYFIFYQYTIITRGYCLILLLLSLIASIYEKRIEKCYIYTILLILLTNLEAYTFLIAGSLYFLYIIDYINNYKNKIKNKHHLICLIIIFISFLFTTFYMLPRGESIFYTSGFSYQISNSFITSPFDNSIIISLSSFLLFLFFIYIYLKTNKKTSIEATIISAPVLIFMIFKYANYWHYGIAFLLLIFLAWIHNLSEKKLFNIFLLMTCIIQIYWSINSSIYDYKETYSPSEEIADFIKQYDYKNLNIYAEDFYSTSINPYFDNNIFMNWQPEYRFFYGNTNNKYYEYKDNRNKLTQDDIDIYICNELYSQSKPDYINDDYNTYIFKGSTYFEKHKYESMTTYIYVKKEIDEK